MAALAANPARAQVWSMMTAPPFYAGAPILLTDGTVLVQAIGWTNGVGNCCRYGTGDWFRLTPDATGGYVDGTWTQIASMPSGYAPIYHATAVLPDGRVLVEGGEYNATGQTSVETSLGAIYDPVANTWTPVNPPANWTQIGDAQSVVLPNGTLMLGNCCTTAQALFDPSTLSWATTPTGKADLNSEEGWVLLPSGKVLTVDLTASIGTTSELYDPSTNSWSAGANIGVALEDVNCKEMGPMVLRPDGSVFAVGGTGQIAIYNSAAGYWTDGPFVGNGLGVDDGPGVLLPDGNVLFIVSPFGAQGGSGCYGIGSQTYESNGTNLTQDPAPPEASASPSYFYEMLMLPTGQVLVTNESQDAEIFTSAGTYQSAWQPAITSAPPSVVLGGANYSISGTQLNGLSQASMYGDDAQMASNFPLVRITNDSTHHVFYCRTHDFSTMAVATGSATVSAEFDVPANIETGESTLIVVANGIPSNPVSVTVNASTGGQNVTVSPTSLNFSSRNGSSPTESATLTNNGPGTLTIYSVEVQGDYFSLASTTCGTTLAQGQSCTARVTFAPGPYCLSSPASGTLTFWDSAVGGEQNVDLNGTTSGCLQVPVKGGPGGSLSGASSGAKPAIGHGGAQ